MTNFTSHTYLALTVGPIVKTLLEARKTRELWAASYLLSSLMKHLANELDPNKENILIPNIPDTVLSNTLYGAGIYPDRLFMQADGWSEAQVDQCIEAALRKLIEETLLKAEKQDDTHKAYHIDQALPFWRSFFRIRYVLKELADISKGALSLQLTPYLENAELEDTCFPEEPNSNELLKLFEENRIYKVALSEGLQGDNRGIYDAIMPKTSFIPDTAEIAAMELHGKVSGALLRIAEDYKKEIDERHEAFYEKIAEDDKLGKHLLPRHKYFCIVHADGDNISRVIQKLDKPENYKTFSETLASYSVQAAEIINNHGGKPIYIGGDDLLFLVPVQNGSQTIFDLIRTLDNAFPKAQLHPDASLSYGLNIVYYKFSLFEAIGDTYHDILKSAKKHTNKAGQKKNAVSFRFTKHSGNHFSATFSKSFLGAIIAAMRIFEKANPKGRKGLVSSLMYKVKTLECLLTKIAEQEEKKKKEDLNYAFDLKGRLDHFFAAYFNEWGDDSGFKKQREATKDLLLAAYDEVVPEDKNWLSLFYAVMRLIDFVSEPDQTQQQHDSKNIAATAE